ncbi:aldose 1-epimerase family protein [Nonomuraea sp. NPDC050310]|uniref:aldose 1-epimerase family protein n=1 Tax=Nonomuraea sp. NPDC050310 TaxID=3154935 RepID=UPI0033C1F024
MRNALSGEQYSLTAGPYTAVVTEQGAGLRELAHGGEALVLAYGPQEPAPAAFGQLLIPWPNRVDHGRYEWDGVPYQLDVNEPAYDCAIHGLARWLPWRVVERENHRVRLACRLLGTPGYPFRLALEAEYSLDAGQGLTVSVRSRNEGETAAPYAHGAHPYLTTGEPIDGCTVTAPGRRHLPVNDRMIPYGSPEPVEGTPFDLREGRRLGDLKIDRAFTDLDRDEAGRAWVHLAGSARTTSFWADATHPWLELYTADEVPERLRRQGFGVEPMTSPPNALASGIDLHTLEPGASLAGSWGIRLG